MLNTVQREDPQYRLLQLQNAEAVLRQGTPSAVRPLLWEPRTPMGGSPTSPSRVSRHADFRSEFSFGTEGIFPCVVL